MDIQQLRSFVQVVKTGSFSKAAKMTYRTQPTISLQVKSLEEELGTRLFERYGPMKVKPTEDAVALEAMVSPLLESFDGLKRRFDEKRGKEGAVEIRIASHESVIAYLLPDVVEAFSKKYKDVRFTFFRKNKADIIAMITSGEADLGITTLEKTPPGVEYRVFRVHRRVLLAPKRHPLTKLARIKPKDIAAYPLILPPRQSETRNLVDEVFKKNQLAYRLSLELTGRDAVKKYVEKGFGISVMNDYYLLPEDRTKLAVIDVSGIFGETSRGLLSRKGRKFSPIHTEFIEALTRTEE